MIYLDNAATSFPKPESVYQALDRFARADLANPGRAGHKMALAAERALDDCRHLLNQLFHGEGPERFIFTLNCTDALNMAFKGVLTAGDHVITSDLEHNSVSRPLRKMELDGRIHRSRFASARGPSARKKTSIIWPAPCQKSSPEPISGILLEKNILCLAQVCHAFAFLPGTENRAR